MFNLLHKILAGIIILGGLAIINISIFGQPFVSVGAPTFRIERSIQPEANNLYWFGTSTRAWSDLFTYNLSASGTITFLGLAGNNNCLVASSTGVISTSTCGAGGGFSAAATSTAGVNVATTTNTLTISLRSVLADISGLVATLGNLIVGNGTTFIAKTVGSDGQFLRASSTATGGIAYETFTAVQTLNTLTASTQSFATSTGLNIVSSGSTHTFSLRGVLQDISGLAVTAGNLIVGNGTNFVAQTVGSNTKVLMASSSASTGVSWENVANTNFSVGSIAKGDLLVGVAAGSVFTRLATGTNGYVLTASSTATNGVSWEASAGGGGGTAYQTIPLYLDPAGAATATSSPAGSNKRIGTNWTVHTLDYDGTTKECAFWTRRLPQFTAVNTFLWELSAQASTVTTASTTVFGITFRPIGDNEAWDATTGETQATTSLSFTVVDRIYHASSSLATSSLASQDMMQFEICREVADSGDAMASDARYTTGKIYMQYR